jgi:hypothetical protein
MTIAQWAGLIVSLISITIAYVGSIRWLVKHYLSELKPNSGSSMKDSLNRLESRIDEIMLILASTNNKK